MACPNCGEEFEGDRCPHCGPRSHSKLSNLVAILVTAVVSLVFIPSWPSWVLVEPMA